MFCNVDMKTVAKLKPSMFKQTLSLSKEKRNHYAVFGRVEWNGMEWNGMGEIKGD